MDIFSFVMHNIEVVAVLITALIFPTLMTIGKWTWKTSRAIGSKIKLPKRRVVTKPTYNVSYVPVTGGVTITVRGPKGRVFDTVPYGWRFKSRLKGTIKRLSDAYGTVATNITRTDERGVWNPAQNWLTREGEILEIAEVTDNHLLNIITCLKEGRGDLGPRITPLILEKAEMEAISRGLFLD